MKSQTIFQKRSFRKLRQILSRNDTKPQIAPGEETSFLYSRPLEDAYPKPTDSFTVLPCRVPLQDDGVRAAIQRLYNDETVMQLVHKGATESSISGLGSPIGHYAALAFPECIPKRLELVTFIMETATVFDNILDDESYAGIKEEVGSALMAGISPAIESPRKIEIQKCMAKHIFEMVTPYGKEGLALLHSCQSGWQGMWDSDGVGITAVGYESYLTQRIGNFSIPALWATTAFSIGVLLTPKEYKLIQPITDIAARLLIQTNDYFSWEVERTNGKDRTFNGIPILMKEHCISEQSAKEKLKAYIMHDEQIYKSVLENFYKTHPILPTHIRKYIVACANFIGGNHQWSAVCPRYKPLETTENKQPRDENCNIETESEQPREGSVETVRPSTTDPSSIRSHTLSVIDEVSLDKSALLASPNYIQSLSSKNIRSKMVDAFNIWLQLPEDSANTIKGVINDLHNATLILDDIQDESVLRRGSSAAHCIFGAAQCINSATYMVVNASAKVYAHNALAPQLMGVFIEGLTDLSIGQSWDLNWKFNSYCPSIAEYMAMIDGKTGAMFKMLVNMMKCLSHSQTWPVAEFDRLTQLLGRWYQVRDDYQNLQDAEYTEKKGFCEDLDEGKLSYPVVLTCNSDPTARAIILGIFRQERNGTPLPRSVKMQMLSLIRKAGALDKTWHLIQDLEKEVEDSLSALEAALGMPNPSLRLITKLLSDIPPP